MSLLRRHLAWLAAALCLAAAAPLVSSAQATRPIVIVVSIDGMRPDYITQADKHGLKIPTLRRLMRDGAYATGVRGVLPTVTYPSHTTMFTGVPPAKHGIYANSPFDPLRKNMGGWYWYAEDIRVPTLWDAVVKNGGTTANVQWPVTVGARSITWNIPEIWRAHTEDDGKLLRSVSTPGIFDDANHDVGAFCEPNADDAPADSIRALYGEWMLEHKRPQLLVVHINALDAAQHEHGAFSKEALAVLEREDAAVGRLWTKANQLLPGGFTFVVLSDHGFLSFDSAFNLTSAFREAGLFTLDSTGRNVADWKAMPWPASGSVAVVIKDPADSATLATVRAIVKRYADAPNSPIERVVEGKALTDVGFPTAALWIGLKSGFRTGSAFDGPVITKVAPGGVHGAAPQIPDLYASFFIVGPGVKPGTALGVVNMLDVAPTLAARLGVSLAGATGKNLIQ